MKTPPDVMTEVDRLAKIRPLNHDVRCDFDGHQWSVYLKPSVPLVGNPQTFEEMTTNMKQRIRHGVFDLDKFFRENQDDCLVCYEQAVADYSQLPEEFEFDPDADDYDYNPKLDLNL